MKYKQRFSSLIPSLQGNRALKRVEAMRETGQVQTQEEFQEALSQELSALSTEELKPTFNFIPFRPGTSDPEHYNVMVGQIKDDLEVAFSELDNIYSVIRAHEEIYKDKIISQLFSSLEKVSSELQKLEVIASTENAFDEVFINNFSGDGMKLSSQNPNARTLLYDLPRRQPVGNVNLAHLDVEEEALLLPLNFTTETPIREIQILDSVSTSPDYDIQVEDSTLNNLLSDEPGNNWIYNVARNNQLNNGATLSLQVSLNDTQKVNKLSIHPASDFPSVLEDITYENPDGQIVQLPVQDIFGTSIESPVSLSFSDILVKRFILTFRQPASSLLSVNPEGQDLTFDDLRRNSGLNTNLKLITDKVNNELVAPDLKSSLPIQDAPDTPQVVVNNYVFAFESISTGLDSYRDNGVFVSSPAEVTTPGQLAVEVSESIPLAVDDNLQTFPSGSFEYSIVKHNYNGAGSQISKSEFNILPLGRQNVENERLFFSAQRNIVNLRFLAHSASGDGSNITVSRNNQELVRGTDWRFADRLGGDSSDQLTPGLDSTRIEILHNNNLVSTGIYTASYTPRFIVDPDNTPQPSRGVSYDSTGLTEHSVEHRGERIEKSDVFLKIAIRNNSFSSSVTPKLTSYRLLTASVNPDRFVRL